MNASPFLRLLRHFGRALLAGLAARHGLRIGPK